MRIPKLPEGTHVYAMTDIHGRADLLEAMMSVVEADLAHVAASRVIHVFLGDYIDRGSDSRRVIDLLVGWSRQHECVFLKGNHEDYLLKIFENPALLPRWYRLGGVQTMRSYGVLPPLAPDEQDASATIARLIDAIPRQHHHFLAALRPSFSCGDFFFAHAGVKPGVPLEQQTEKDLLWIREDFLTSRANFGKYVIHGHTPVLRPDFQPNRANIDTGAYATGNLTLLTIDGSSMLAI